MIPGNLQERARRAEEDAKRWAAEEGGKGLAEMRRRDAERLRAMARKEPRA